MMIKQNINKGIKLMKLTDKIKYISMNMEDMDAHSANCNDCNMPKYHMHIKYSKDVEIVKSPFADYTDLEFTNLMMQTRCGVNGNDSMDTPVGNDIIMISENQYIIDVYQDDEDFEYAVDDNGNKVKFTLQEIKDYTCMTEYTNIKMFPCTKNVKVGA